MKISLPSITVKAEPLTSLTKQPKRAIRRGLILPRRPVPPITPTKNQQPPGMLLHVTNTGGSNKANLPGVFMKQTGYPHGRPGYVIDHKVPLKRGGCDCPENMQWQTKAAAKAKDKCE